MITGRAFLSLAALALLVGATPPGMDPVNPTCPVKPDWTAEKAMKLTVRKSGDIHVLVAEGAIDNGLLPRLSKALASDDKIGEIWLRSPGGVAAVGNAAGMMIRKQYPGMVTRIPAGWTCFSACNFIFMGGNPRIVDPGGVFMVHMFTHVADREGVKAEIRADADAAVDMIAEIEQNSALLASDDNDFLIRMYVSRTLLTELMYQQKAVGKDGATRRCLSAAELEKYNVTNAKATK